MTIIIPNPQTKSFTQLGTSDILGTFESTCSIDLQENVGKIRVGKRMLVSTSSSDAGTNMDKLYNPVAFAVHTDGSTDKIYSLGGGTSGNGRIFKSGGTSLVGNLTVDTSANAPTDIDFRYSDMTTGSNGNLYATSEDTLYECSNGTWSATTRSLSTGSPHMLAVYAQRLYVTTLGSQILSCDISGSSFGTLATIGTSYTLKFSNTNANYITWIRPVSNGIWIGTINKTGGKGHVYFWNGQSTQPSQSFRLESQGTVACVIKDDIPYIMDVTGSLLIQNGGTFQRITSLPKESRLNLWNPLSSVNNRFIHPNGLANIHGDIHALLKNQYYESGTHPTVDDTTPAGIWAYSPMQGFSCRYTLSYADSDDTITDYGQYKLAQVGAISEVPNLSTNTNGTFLAGAVIYTNGDTTEKTCIWYDDTNDTKQKVGYFVTTQIEASNILDSFNSMYIKHRKMLNSSDKIVIKSRTTYEEAVEAKITWIDTTSFTVSNSDVDVSEYWTSGTGGEVQIIQGIGSGICSHIVNAENNSGTWTVTVDETHTGATGTARAFFSKWNKIDTINNMVSQISQDMPIPETDRKDIYIQFKVWCLFTGRNEIHSLSIINKTHQSS